MRTPIALAFMLLSGAAFAQQGPVDKVKACAGVKDDAARLKCYDTAVPGLQSDIQVPVLKVPDPVAAQKPPSTSTIIAPETPDSITLTATSIQPGADGKLRFILSNGEIWRQTDSIQLRNLGKGPWKAEVRKAALGSFMLKVDNKPPVRARRVE
jgi:hypothetical protein